MYSQVAVGTVTPDDGSALEISSTTGALVPPRMTTTQMNAIPTPLDGAVIYNTTVNSLYLHSSGTWSSLGKNNGTLVVNKDYSNSNNNTIVGTDNTYFDFPIGPGDILSNDTSLYNVTGNGTVTINESGNYLFSASFSMIDAPDGNNKYIIAITINDTLTGYLSRGFASLPETNYWGTSGNIIYPITAGQVVKFRYVFNSGSVARDAKFFNFGISKLN